MEPLPKEEYLKLVEKYLAGNASEQEIRFLEAYYDAFNSRDGYTDTINQKEHAKLSTRLKKKTDQRISYYETRNKFNFLSLHLVKYAAILLAVITGIAYFATQRNVEHESRKFAQAPMPGTDKAVLTLANGQKLILDSTKQELLLQEHGLIIHKTAEGYLTYAVADKQATQSTASVNEPLYNTISTPSGGQYSVLLSDGTKVWLNASSSLTFPVHFDDSRRVVELEGEGYFEVAKSPNKKRAQPFIVKTATQKVEVLGTHFNINAYADEQDIKTTLIEGSVRIVPVHKNAQAVVLKPDQQSVISRTVSEPEIKVIQVTAEAVIDWKNGNFIFDRENLPAIMRKIARWYNVEVEYRGKMPLDEFGGQISRSKTLSDVLNVLELSGGVRFKVVGNKVIVQT